MRKITKIIFILLVLGVLGGTAYAFYPSLFKQKEEAPVASKEELFTADVYSMIQENYWNKVTDEALSNLFRLAAEKIAGKPIPLPSPDKDGVVSLTKTLLDGKSEADRKAAVTNLADLVLINLEPFGRNRLMSLAQEKELRNTVSNINPGTDLYGELGVKEGASEDDIEKAFKEKADALAKDSSPEAAEKLERLAYAKSVLSDESQKARYDDKGIEPTVFSSTIGTESYYIFISKVSPTTFDEFIAASNKAPEGRNQLVLDLRGNVGGAVDYLQYFLGLFIGPNQYAYDFFHQGDYTPFKTKVGKLPSLSNFKRIVVLTDNAMQSSAETMAAAFKKYNVGVLVGTTTKGHGTIENTFKVPTVIDDSTEYYLFLVHSITLRDDGEPIEGRGVDPHISTGDKDWKNKLSTYYNSAELLKAVEGFIRTGPKK